MLDRRGFLKFIGGAAVGTLATPVIWKGLDDVSIWSQNWSWIPSLEYGNHENTFVRTTSKMCPSAVGTRIRLVGGRPVRVLGDPESPLSRGGVSSLAVTEVQMRYSPARLKRPLLKSADGGFREISWEKAEAILAQKLAAAKGQQEGVVCVSGDENGSMNELFSGFTAQMGSDRFFLMPSDAVSTAQAWQNMGGEGRLGFDFANSDYVLAIGANVLETWGTVVCNRRAWGDAHPTGKPATMRLAYAGSVQGNTATGADMWLPILPGTETYLLLGIAHQLLKAGKVAAVDELDAFKAAAAPWNKEKTCEATGLTAAMFDAFMKDLMQAKAPVVLVGSDTDQSLGTLPAMLGIAVNVLMGRLNRDGGVRCVPTTKPVVAGGLDYNAMMSRDLLGYAASVAAGSTPDIGVLMFYEANPVYALPKALDAVFTKSAFSVSFSCFLDETAQRCDLVLPNALGLERYDDVAYPFGYGKLIYTLVTPVAEPLFQARPAGEVLIGLSEKLGLKLGVTDVVDMLRAKAVVTGADWAVLSGGDAFVSDAVLSHAGKLSFGLAPGFTATLAKAPEKAASRQLSVAYVNKLALGTAETAIPPFNTKLIDREELEKNVLVAAVNGATLKKLGLYEGNMVTLTGKSAVLRARLRVFEGVTNDTVALTMGFGHTAFGEFNDGKGMNVMTLVAPVAEPGKTGLGPWCGTIVNVAKA